MNGRLVIITDNHKIPRKYRGQDFRYRVRMDKGKLIEHPIYFGDKYKTKTSQMESRESKHKHVVIEVFKRYIGSPNKPLPKIHPHCGYIRIGDRDFDYSWTSVGNFQLKTNLVRFKTDRAIQRDYAPEKLDRQHGSKGISN